MQDAVKISLAKLPEQVIGYAPTMAARAVATMHQQLARDAHLPQMSYAGLLVKLGASDLARGFVAHLSDTLRGKSAAQPQPAFAASTISRMSLELQATDGPDLAMLALQASSDRFKALNIRAKSLGLREFRVYGKDLFLAALREGFVMARIDDSNVALLRPYACGALNAELVALYERFDVLLDKIQQARASGPQ